MKVLGSRGGLVAVLMVSLLVGCSARQPDAGEGDGTTDSVAERKKRRANILKSLMTMAQPEVLAIETDRATVVSLLNDWAGLEETATTVKPIDPVYTSRLAKALQDKVAEPRFSRRDVGHIRNGLWYARVAALAAGDARTDLQRVVRLFRYVSRNVALRADEDTRLPLAPFGIAMLGDGNSHDRAWLFANLLRQFRIDSVILRCGDQPRFWLFGVLLGEEVYLFDTNLGLPIPADRTQPNGVAIDRPATLKQVVQDSTLLSGLAGDATHPYPVTANSLAAAKIEVVGSTSFWAQRMRHLQMSLAGEESIVLWDPLESSELVPEGVLARLKLAGFDSEGVTVWKYPEERLEGNAAFDNQQRQVFRLRTRAFDAPVPIAQILQDGQNREVRIVMGPAQFRHRLTRNRQLMGDLKSSVTAYLGIRLWRDVPPLPEKTPFISRGQYAVLKTLLPTQVRFIHEEAADDASFWIGVCQYEQGQVASAAKSMRSYRERSGPHEWAGAARWRESQCLAELGQLDEAVSLLKQTRPDDLRWAGSQVLLRRWQRLLAARPAGGGDAKKATR